MIKWDRSLAESPILSHTMHARMMWFTSSPARLDKSDQDLSDISFYVTITMIIPYCSPSMAQLDEVNFFAAGLLQISYQLSIWKLQLMRCPIKPFQPKDLATGSMKATSRWEDTLLGGLPTLMFRHSLSSPVVYASPAVLVRIKHASYRYSRTRSTQNMYGLSIWRIIWNTIVKVIASLNRLSYL